MKQQGQLALLCGADEHRLSVSVRDVGLLDGRFFAPPQAPLMRPVLGLVFVAGLTAPPLNTVLVTHRRAALLAHLKGLVAGLEDHKDLLSRSYAYAFDDAPGAGHGATSGFCVRGLMGFISTHPDGYCDLTLSELAPTGRSRVVEIVDMRRTSGLNTDDRGVLSVTSRAAEVGWFTCLPAAIAWLAQCDDDVVQILHR